MDKTSEKGKGHMDKASKKIKRAGMYPKTKRYAACVLSGIAIYEGWSHRHAMKIIRHVNILRQLARLHPNDPNVRKF